MALKAYVKDTDTGIVSLHTGGTVRLLSPTRPGKDTVTAWVQSRNESCRVVIPDDNEPFEWAIIVKGKTFIVGSGVTATRTAGKGTPVFIRVRQEEEVAMPTRAALGEID